MICSFWVSICTSVLGEKSLPYSLGEQEFLRERYIKEMCAFYIKPPPATVRIKCFHELSEFLFVQANKKEPNNMGKKLSMAVL